MADRGRYRRVRQGPQGQVEQQPRRGGAEAGPEREQQSRCGGGAARERDEPYQRHRNRGDITGE